MKLIQFILIPAFLIAIIIYYRRFRTLLLDRVLVLLLGLLGVVFVLNPDWTGGIAQDLGVGRGVDLMIYLSITALGFFCMTLWSILRDIDARLTEIVRGLAMKEPKDPDSGKA